MKNIPEIRFDGFSDEWEQCKLGEIAEYRRGSFPQPYGNKEWYDGEEAMPFIQVADVTDEMNLTADTKQKISKLAQPMSVFANKGSVLVTLQGSIGRVALTQYDAFIDRTILMFENYKKEINPVFWAYIIKQKFIEEAEKAPGAIIKTITKEALSDFDLSLPNYKEQVEIGKYLSNLNHLISLYQQKLNILQNNQKALLDNIFPRNNEDVPRIRFNGFIDSWQKNKFSDLVLIERGASPRPIDFYITDNPNGLNWIKIGDVPTLGRYITKTTEKIKSEGLSQTKQVYPGDLILSNSMSFGKPYIVGINGCIHDGWLLIRDTKNNFDLKFLCHMLGSNQMINQYNMLAGGSTVNNLNKELVGNTVVTFPSIAEQRVIGKYLDFIDNIIVLYQQKIDALKNIKNALSQKIFA